MTAFENSLRTALLAAPVAHKRAGKIISVLDSPPSHHRSRVLARMQAKAAEWLKADEATIDWSQVNWVLVIFDIVKLLLTVITLFGTEESSPTPEA